MAGGNYSIGVSLQRYILPVQKQTVKRILLNLIILRPFLNIIIMSNVYLRLLFVLFLPWNINLSEHNSFGIIFLCILKNCLFYFFLFALISYDFFCLFSKNLSSQEYPRIYFKVNLACILECIRNNFALLLASFLQLQNWLLNSGSRRDVSRIPIFLWSVVLFSCAQPRARRRGQ